MCLLDEIYKGNVPLHILNFGVITLLLKKAEATKIQEDNPICRLNVSFKIFKKVLTNLISAVAHKEIRPTTTFLPGRFILESVVVLLETIHEIRF